MINITQHPLPKSHLTSQQRPSNRPTNFLLTHNMTHRLIRCSFMPMSHTSLAMFLPKLRFSRLPAMIVHMRRIRYRTLPLLLIRFGFQGDCVLEVVCGLVERVVINLLTSK